MGTITLSLPQTGLPNSTEDVKVTNDLTLIQNVINGNLDASNLSTTSGIMRLGVTVPGSNYAANYGDLVNAAAGITVTLPTPRSNALVGVVAQGGTTGANPVTVAGTNIYGVGLTAASSFKLGVPIAATLLQSDGTNWIVVSGQQDTGWVALSLAGGITAQAGYTPASRLLGDRVYVRGGLHNTSAGAAFPGPHATIAVGSRPAQPTALATGRSATSIGVIGVPVSTAGQIGTGVSSNNGDDLYVLDACSFPLS